MDRFVNMVIAICCAIFGAFLMGMMIWYTSQYILGQIALTITGGVVVLMVYRWWRDAIDKKADVAAETYCQEIRSDWQEASDKQEAEWPMLALAMAETYGDELHWRRLKVLSSVTKPS